MNQKQIVDLLTKQSKWTIEDRIAAKLRIEGIGVRQFLTMKSDGHFDRLPEPLIVKVANKLHYLEKGFDPMADSLQEAAERL